MGKRRETSTREVSRLACLRSRDLSLLYHPAVHSSLSSLFADDSVIMHYLLCTKHTFGTDSWLQQDGEQEGPHSTDHCYAPRVLTLLSV